MTKEQSDHKWVLFAIGALLSWGIWAFLPKVALQSIPPHSVLFYESLGGFIAAVPVFVLLRGKVGRDRRGISLAFFATVLLLIASFAFLLALKSAPVVVVVTITSLYPIITLLLARFFLKEKINRQQILACLCALAAIYLLAG